MPKALFVSVVLLASLLVGCTPPSGPLYRDYARATPEADEAVLARLEQALAQAGWTVAPPRTPGVVATEDRTLRDWGLYRLDVSLEAAPLGRYHVRVFVHPYRRFVTGGRSKLFALDAGLREAIFPDLDQALAEEGFEMIYDPVHDPDRP